MNKKGDVFMLGLDILFFVAIVLIFAIIVGEFKMENPDEPLGSRQIALLHTYALSEEMLHYIDVSARFAAYEALERMFKNAGVSLVDSECGTYATYQSWTSLGKRCFPTEEDIRTTYQNEIAKALRARLNYPGMPRNIDYDITAERDNQILKIIGLTEDEITLPIAYAQDDHQVSLDAELARASGVQGSLYSFSVDSNIKGVQLKPSPNKRPRLGPTTNIVITTTGTGSAGEAINAYQQGLTSVHYVIDQQGIITQLVPEDQRANAFADCVDRDGNQVCTKEDPDDGAIVIALVNSGVIREPVKDQCEEGVKLAPFQWCRTDPFSGQCPNIDYRAEHCWDSYPANQRTALKFLTVDIAKRQGIQPSPNTIFYEEHFHYEKIMPGPALAELDRSPKDWYNDIFMKDMIKWTNDPNFVPGKEGSGGDTINNLNTQGTGMTISLPVRDPRVTSCYGDRKIMKQGKLEDDFHDGLDFGGKQDVFPIASGTVVRACKDVSSCGDLGKHVFIRHDQGLYSKYSHMSQIDVNQNDIVTPNKRIGITGNTGSSSATHLDIKIYESIEDSNKREGGSNPLCFFSSDQLSQLEKDDQAESCLEEVDAANKFTRSSPQLQEDCEGIEPLFSAPPCGFISMTSSNEDLEITRGRLTDLGLVGQLQKESDKNGLDWRLVLSLIAKESVGEPTIVNSAGYAGLGQIGVPACTDLVRWGTWDTNCNKECECSGTNTFCYAISLEGCEGDPRIDPVKSIKGIPVYLKNQIDQFSGPDATRFGLASYNAGAGNIKKAMNDAKSSPKHNPTWEETIPFLKSYMTVDKFDEVTNYVSEISEICIAQGCSIGTAYTASSCAGVKGKVKQYGTYSFRPSFSTEVTDSLVYLEATVKCAEDIYKRCNGKGVGAEEDTRECLRRNLLVCNNAGIEVTACEDPSGESAMNLQRFVQDCRDNKQSDCICSGDFKLTADEMRVRPRGETLYIMVDGNPVGDWVNQWATRYAETPEDDVENVPVELLFTSGDPDDPFGRKLQFYEVKNMKTENDLLDVIIKDAPEYMEVRDGVDAVFEKDGDEIPAPNLSIVKRDGELVWTKDPQETPFCGIYKTDHHICVNIKSRNQKIRFALHLEDEKPPDPIPTKGLCVESLGSYIKTIFAGSTSSDISYYRVACREFGIMVQPDSTKFTQILGRANDEPIKEGLNLKLEECFSAGNSFSLRSIRDLINMVDDDKYADISPDKRYMVTLTPYDISGNVGNEVHIMVKSFDEKINDEDDVWSQWLGEELGIDLPPIVGDIFDQTGWYLFINAIIEIATGETIEEHVAEQFMEKYYWETEGIECGYNSGATNPNVYSVAPP
ncbi:peptidoglycan DD-metalloendopeptidase family protein [Candidatus Woesearchaeota archaeon]|nr:peptidoglycan DD-metalloendopeptidase family protein [Candidatus Woesearchaeota archaeon]